MLHRRLYTRRVEASGFGVEGSQCTVWGDLFQGSVKSLYLELQCILWMTFWGL